MLNSRTQNRRMILVMEISHIKETLGHLLLHAALQQTNKSNSLVTLGRGPLAIFSLNTSTRDALHVPDLVSAYARNKPALTSMFYSRPKATESLSKYPRLLPRVHNSLLYSY